VPDLGSEEGSGDEGGKKNVEDIFMQCLPPDTRSKSLSAKSHEIVDLTDLETSDRGHSSSASSSHRLMQPTPFVEGIYSSPLTVTPLKEEISWTLHRYRRF
jgi:hypothetical protein